MRVLAAAGIIDGLEVVGHADYQEEYESAGAIYLGSDHPPVIQGNIVTSGCSQLYGTAMCEAIRKALPPTMGRPVHRIAAASPA